MASIEKWVEERQQKALCNPLFFSHFFSLSFRKPPKIRIYWDPDPKHWFKANTVVKVSRHFTPIDVKRITNIHLKLGVNLKLMHICFLSLFSWGSNLYRAACVLPQVTSSS